MSKIGTIGKAIIDYHPRGFFSLDQIEELTGFSRKYVTDTLVILSQEGLVKKIKKQQKEHIPGHSPRFSLTYMIANKKALAARVAPRLKEKTVQDRMWFVIRKKRYFSLRDLIILAEVTKGMARWYLKSLRKMGIIKSSRTGGGPGVEWMLINDIGPRRPYIKTNLKRRGRAMKEKDGTATGMTKRTKRVKVLLSKAERRMLENQASKHGLSASAYVRMLVREAAGSLKSAS